MSVVAQNDITNPLFQEALLLQQAGDTKSALRKYEDLLSVSPTSEGYTNYGIALRTFGHIQAAIIAESVP